MPVIYRLKQEDFCEFKASLDCIVLARGQPQLQCETLSQKTESKQILAFSFLISGVQLKLEKEEMHIKWGYRYLLALASINGLLGKADVHTAG